MEGQHSNCSECSERGLCTLVSQSSPSQQELFLDQRQLPAQRLDREGQQPDWLELSTPSRGPESRPGCDSLTHPRCGVWTWFCWYDEGMGDAVSRTVVWTLQGKVWGVCLTLAGYPDGSREWGAQCVGRGRVQEAVGTA